MGRYESKLVPGECEQLVASEYFTTSDAQTTTYPFSLHINVTKQAGSNHSISTNKHKIKGFLYKCAVGYINAIKCTPSLPFI